MQNMTKHTLLKGEGANQHTLYGSFATNTANPEFGEVKVKDDSVLRHEQPDGSFSNEHKALKVDKGNWVMGRQIEYHPFKREITQIWD